MTDLTDFDGCRRICRKAGKHTMVWGECEYAPKPPDPEPMVYIHRRGIAGDGYPMFWYEPVAIKDLDEVQALQRKLNDTIARLEEANAVIIEASRVLTTDSEVFWMLDDADGSGDACRRLEKQGYRRSGDGSWYPPGGSNE